MNTLENKAKFFAQYWGVNCLKNELLNPKLPSQKVYSGNCKGLPQQFLELTPLSQITDEDVCEVCKICGLIVGNTSEDYLGIEDYSSVEHLRVSWNAGFDELC